MAAKGVTFSHTNEQHTTMTSDTSAWSVGRASSGGDCSTTTSRQPTQANGPTSVGSVRQHSSTQSTSRNTGVFTPVKSLTSARSVLTAHCLLIARKPDSRPTKKTAMKDIGEKE